jgi:uncharacterized protein YjbI with pentapeptide repeats
MALGETMKTSISLILLAVVLTGCETVSSADLYKANFGQAILPAANFDPATINNGPYNPFNQRQPVCNSASPACTPSAQSQWENEFR